MSLKTSMPTVVERRSLEFPVIEVVKGEFTIVQRAWLKDKQHPIILAKNKEM